MWGPKLTKKRSQGEPQICLTLHDDMVVTQKLRDGKMIVVSKPAYKIMFPHQLWLRLPDPLISENRTDSNFGSSPRVGMATHVETPLQRLLYLERRGWGKA